MLKITITNKSIVEQSFFNNLNPTKKDKTFSKRSISEKLKNAYNDSDSDEEKKIYRFIRIRLKNILIGDPTVLNEIVKIFNFLISPKIFIEIDKDSGKQIESEISKKIKSIFNYKSFRSSEFCVDYLKGLGFKKSTPCPYCNFDELSIITKDLERNNQALLDLDHFIPQSKYPFLALSMYNLIPSCHNCNSGFKGETLFLIDTHINPFDKSFDEYFSFKLSQPFIINMNNDDFQIEYQILKDFKNNTITDLKLIERYNAAKEGILDKFNQIAKMRVSKIIEIEDLLEEKIDILELAEIPKNNSEITRYKLGKLKRDLYLDIFPTI